MNDLPLISVITIAFNDLEGLRKTIASVADQSGSPIEHIIVDGGSTDGTADYLRSLAPGTKWISERDEGRYDAMNKGASLAEGQILWFLHSSDIFHSSHSAAYVANRYQLRTFAWGYGMSNKVKDGISVGTAGMIPFNHARFVLGGHPIPHQASVFDREFFLSLGGYDLQFGLTADQLLFVEAAKRASPEVWAEVLCDFDTTGAGSTRGALAHFSDMTRARRHAQVKVFGYASDSALSRALALSTMFARRFRSILRSRTPEGVGQ